MKGLVSTIDDRPHLTGCETWLTTRRFLGKIREALKAKLSAWN